MNIYNRQAAGSYVCVWQKIFLSIYFTIQFIFATIHRSHCTISANFYLYLQYFQQKVFSFSKISRSQTDPMSIWSILRQKWNSLNTTWIGATIVGNIYEILRSVICKIEKNMHQRKQSYKIIFTWFGNSPTSKELQ